MAELAGNLWNYNIARVLVVDVTDDYRLMQPSLPSVYYPVLREIWLPRHNLAKLISRYDLLPGYLYDWHELPSEDSGEWYVGVVAASLASEPLFQLRHGLA